MNAIIFDLDGVLCHTDEYHYMAWKAIADELHISFNREVNNQLRGVSRMESLKLILRNSPVCYSEQEKFLLAEKKNNIYRELLQNITSKDLADGAWTVLEKLHAVHIPMAIGSSSKNTPLIVEKLGIGKFFDAIVDGNQISHSKPDPEVFLLAAEKLHQKPSDCPQWGLSGGWNRASKRLPECQLSASIIKSIACNKRLADLKINQGGYDEKSSIITCGTHIDSFFGGTIRFCIGWRLA